MRYMMLLGMMLDGHATDQCNLIFLKLTRISVNISIMMKEDQFFDGLCEGSFEERLAFLQAADFDLLMDCQPECVLECFHHVTNTEQDAARVVNVIAARWGTIIVCRESSFCERRIMLLGDVVDIMLQFGAISYLMHEACVIFPRADALDPREIRRRYCEDPLYAQDHHQIAIDINYKPLRGSIQGIAQELQEVLYHPKRIAAWLASGKDLEDYLN